MQLAGAAFVSLLGLLGEPDAPGLMLDPAYGLPPGGWCTGGVGGGQACRPGSKLMCTGHAQTAAVLAERAKLAFALDAAGAHACAPGRVPEVPAALPPLPDLLSAPCEPAACAAAGSPAYASLSAPVPCRVESPPTAKALYQALLDNGYDPTLPKDGPTSPRKQLAARMAAEAAEAEAAAARQRAAAGAAAEVAPAPRIQTVKLLLRTLVAVCRYCQRVGWPAGLWGGHCCSSRRSCTPSGPHSLPCCRSGCGCGEARQAGCSPQWPPVAHALVQDARLAAATLDRDSLGELLLAVARLGLDPHER